MPAPLVIAGGVALRQGAVWLGRRVVVPAARSLWTGLGRLTSGVGKRMSISTLGNALNLFNTAQKATPTHFEEVDVTVFGSPKATKRDLWRIAVAAAFGKVQRLGLGLTGVVFDKSLLPPPGFIQMEYPLEGNAVRIVLRMETPYLSLLAGKTRVKREFELYTGPPEDLRGGSWGYDSVLPGVGAIGLGSKYPKTGFEDRTLLTPSPLYRDKNGEQRASASPHPIKDKTSRSSAPVAESAEARLLDPTNTYTEPTYLLFQALSAPCVTNIQPPPQTPPVQKKEPFITDLVTGAPLPLPNQNPSGTPNPDLPYDPNYQPPTPDPIPPQNGGQLGNPQMPVPPATQQPTPLPDPSLLATQQPNLPPGIAPTADQSPFGPSGGPPPFLLTGFGAVPYSPNLTPLNPPSGSSY